MTTQKLRQQPQQLIPLLLAAGLLIIFAFVAWKMRTSHLALYLAWLRAPKIIRRNTAGDSTRMRAC